MTRSTALAVLVLETLLIALGLFGCGNPHPTAPRTRTAADVVDDATQPTGLLDHDVCAQQFGGCQ